MNEEYIKSLYDWLVSQDNEFSNVSLQDFSEGLKNETYVKEIHNYLSQKDNSFASLDEFSAGLKSTQQPMAQEQPVKKKEDWESSWFGGDGTSESEPSKTKQEPYNPNAFLEEYTKSQSPVIYEAPKTPLAYREGSYPDLKNRIAAIDSKMEKASTYDKINLFLEKSDLQSKIKEIESSPVREYAEDDFLFGKPVDITAPKFIEENLNALTARDLSQFGTEGAKERLDYYFKDAGFKVEKGYGNSLEITSPTGETHTLNTIYPSSKSLNDLKDFIRINTYNNPEIAKKEYLYEKENKKFRTKEEVNNEIKNISEQEKKFNDEYKEYLRMQKDIEDIKKDLKRFEDFNEQNTPKYIQTAAYLKEKEQEFIDYQSSMVNKAESLKEQSTQLNKAVGKYTEMQSTQGDWGGTLYRSITNTVANNFSQFLRLTTSKSIDIAPLSYLYPDEETRNAIFQEKLKERGLADEVNRTGTISIKDKKEIEAEMRDDLKKAAISGKVGDTKLNNVLTIDGIREAIKQTLNAPIETTEEYKQKLEKEGSFITRGLIGLAGSLPAMVGGPALRYINMYLMTTDAAMQEMDNDPDFADISENEKQLVAMPMGVIGAALEEIGFKNLKLGKSITSNIVKSVIGRVPVGATASQIRRTTLDVVTEMGIRGTTAFAGGILSEAETGAAQQINEYLTKDIYNAMKGKKMFDNPAFLSTEYLYDIYDASRTEAVGAGVMSVPYSISAAFQKDGFQGLDDATFKIFEDLAKDNDSRKFFVTSLKNKINQGEITPNQSKKLLEAYDQSSGMIAQVPDEIIDPNDRKIAMDLMAERKRLQNKIEGKDPALSKPIQDKINNINEQLNTLTQDAIQKQATSEVSLQPETEPGKEMEAGGPEAGPQTAPKQGVLSPEESKRKEYKEKVRATAKDEIAKILDNNELTDQQKESEIEKIVKAAKTQMEIDIENISPITALNDFGNAITLTPNSGFKNELLGLGYSEADIANMTFEQQQEIVQNKTKAPEVASSAKVDAVKENKRQERIAEMQAELDAETEQQATPEGLGAQLELAEKEAAPIELAETFTEQDKARQQELTDALAKADKRRKNITVGETVMPKADVKAELDALNQKELSSQQPVTKPVQKLTPEQEAAELEKLFNAPRNEKPTSQKEKNVIRNTILNAAKAIAKVLPKVNIVVHETIDDYINATGDTEASSGLYVPSADGGTIHINLENSNRRTAGHEVFHAILLRGIKTDAEAQRLAKAMLNAVMKSLNQSRNNQELLGKIQEFVSNYDENIQNEESLAEIFGYLSDGYPSLDAPTKNIIQRFLDRIAKLFGLKAMNDKDIIDFMNTIAKKVATGEEITESDIEAINQGASTFIFNPTTIRVLPRKQRSSVEINKNFNLSFVDKKDIIDIESLINDIANKKQKVWFWVADQLGRGFYYDTIINKEHYLDAGPSFALDPQNRSRGVIWASGAEVNLLEKNVNQSDYIFIISGSPESSKLFNKTVFDLFAKRIGDFESFKKDVLENKPTKAMREVLMAHDSWDTLREDSSTDNIKTKKIGTGRKKFLIAINESLSKPNSSTYKILENKNALLDINELRDGFYKENGFGLNDIMLVLKPTSVGGKSNHSTYENDILGEVIGVPNRIVNSFDIMPEEIKNKYKNITETQKSQVIAPYGVGIREVSGLTPRQQKVKYAEPVFIDGEGWAVKTLPNKYDPLGGISVKTYPTKELAKVEADKQSERIAQKISDKDEAKKEADKLDQQFPSARKQVTAYHGSPHKFDKFTTDKMGTGEGIQAFGWGLYFTDLKSIAQQYARNLSKPNYNKIKQRLLNSGEKENVKNDIIDFSEYYDYDYNKVVDALRKNENEDAVKFLEKNKDLYEASEGNLYQVTLHQGKSPDQYTWLEWTGKPNKEQIQKLFSKLTREQIDEAFYYGLPPDATNETIYKGLSKIFKSPQKASLFLLENGIDGIKFPAESISRGATSETARGFNYVVFDENAIEITARHQKAKKELKDIIKTARANGYSDEGIRIYLKKIGLEDADIDTLLQEEKGAGKKITVSEKTLPGYNKLMNRIAGIIGRSRKRGLTDEKIMENVINNVEANSPEYANATDQQREQIIRDIRAMFGKKEKKAPTAQKILGKPKPETQTKTVNALRKEFWTAWNKSAREAKADLNTKRKMLAAAIKDMVKKGKITTRQAAVLINKVNNTNLDNPVMVERLLTYAEKVFNDAEYADKLNKANDLQSDIKKLSRNTKKFGNLTPFAAEFAKIDPAMVENIDEYIEMASKVKEGVQGSKIVRGNVVPADMVDVGKTMEYVNKMMEAQDKLVRQKAIESLQNLMDVDVSDLTYDKIVELIDLVRQEENTSGDQQKEIAKKIEEFFNLNKDREKSIRDAINKMFDSYAAVINDMFETGIDPFSDPDNPTTVEFKDSDKKIVEEFMAMDLSLLDAKEALRAADALNNFLTNKSTAGMLATLGDYNGRKNIKEVVAQGKKAKQIKMYWSPILGKTYFQQIASIPAFFERLFKSYDTGRYIREMMGINSLVNHKADAVTAANKIINNYILEFSKKRPNNKNFQDISNIIERGIIGDLAKTIIGDAKQVEAEFNRRKKLIEQSIKILEEAGTKKESQMAKAMKEAYDKIAKDSKTIEEVKAKADQINVDAVQFWVDTWAKLFDQFADVALNVYNRVLDKNVNYVPDRFGFIEIAENKQKDADGFESTFFANNNSEYFYKKEAGSLMKSTPPQSLLDEDGNSTGMYVNLSFDTNNANSLMDALIDIKTAADIRQIQAFKNDSNFKNVFPFGKDAIAVKERIAAMIRNIRNKRAITDKSFKEMIRKMDRIAALGTSLLLAGPTQAISQTIPVAINTIINSGGKLNLSIINNKDANKFIDESGMGIANRGSDAVTELETLNQKLEVAAKTKAGAAAQYIEKLNREYLKLYLSNFDVLIARASWITYYEKGLKKQGIKGKVDYSNHKLNKEAAQYAQDMVDRQQNISDKDLAGQFYNSDNPLKQLIVKVIMPLTTFRMNQTTRFSNDLAILISKTASTEERKEAAVSIGGFAAEMATFRALKLYIGYYLFYSLAQFIRGEEDDEEEKKKTWDNMKKGAATSIVSDVFSPIPQTDVPIKNLFSAVLDQLQNIASIEDDDKFNIFTENKASFASDFGLLGVSIDKILKLGERIELARTGKFKDEFGNEKTISESDRALLSNPFYIGINIASAFGLNPFAPETDNVMNRITKMAKKNAMSNNQLKEAEELGVGNKKDLLKAKAERKAMKEEAYGGYETLEEFEKNDPEKFDEYSARGGKLYKYRESERLEEEEKNKDKPFRGLSEKKFKELYPREWRENYGPGTEYFREQNTPEKRRERAMEKREEAKREMLRKRREVQEKIRERQERYGR